VFEKRLVSTSYMGSLIALSFDGSAARPIIYLYKPFPPRHSNRLICAYAIRSSQWPTSSQTKLLGPPWYFRCFIPGVPLNSYHFRRPAASARRRRVHIRPSGIGLTSASRTPSASALAGRPRQSASIPGRPPPCIFDRRQDPLKGYDCPLPHMRIPIDDAGEATGRWKRRPQARACGRDF